MREIPEFKKASRCEFSDKDRKAALGGVVCSFPVGAAAGVAAKVGLGLSLAKAFTIGISAATTTCCFGGIFACIICSCNPCCCRNKKSNEEEKLLEGPKSVTMTP